MPGGAAFSLAGFVARLPISMQSLGIVLLVAAARGSYGLAGGVSATFLVAGAAAAPVLGRLTDRLGQSRVLFAAVAVHTVGLGSLIVLGAGGTRLRDVGSAARREIEALLGGRVYLDLHVNVLKDWQRDPRQLRRLGF